MPLPLSKLSIGISYAFISQFLCSIAGRTQQLPDPAHRIVVAGEQYAAGEKQERRWGRHYRREWTTPVKVKVAMLDTLAGGLSPYQEGGGRQSRTLRLRDSRGREYVLRSIDKSYGRALPEIARGTFIEAIANDQVSAGHPYAAVTIPPMMEAAGIYHARPQILFIPRQAALGRFSEEYGDHLYLFEQRPDENWEDAPHFGYSKNIVGTEKMRENLLGDHKNRIDQLAYVRARLFDFIIGDWSRHEDQWRWASFETGHQRIYRPVPRDRDQAYTLFDGNMVRLLFRVAGFDHMQSFGHHIEDIQTYNFPARHLDRLAAIEPSQQEWEEIAHDLQSRLTDEIIEKAIRQMPPEVFPISGPAIISKIRARRDQLATYALEYYRFLALEVDIPGSDQRELFEVVRIDDDRTSVRIFRVTDSGHTEQEPMYSRTFLTGETREIRLYGLGGDDRFIVSGRVNNSSLLRIIPGEGIDSVYDDSRVKGGKKMTRVYDDEGSGIVPNPETVIRISGNKKENAYEYAHFEYDEKGIVFRPGLTIGLGYHIRKQKWRKDPDGLEHSWMGYYGPNRGSLAFEYRLTMNQLLGKWNLGTLLRADFPFVANYFGAGNESVMDPKLNRKYYRYRATGIMAGVELNRMLDSTHHFLVGAGIQSVKIISDSDRISSKPGTGIQTTAMDRQYFAMAEAAYRMIKSDHPVVPTRGYAFNLAGTYTQNLVNPGRSISRYSGNVSVYIPLLKVFSLAVRAGAEAITGKPEFYQLATLSGKENLRGFRRQRFHGKTIFYNNNEIRLLLDTRNRLFNGRVGVLVFVDQGRVWQPGERSDRWHVSYGGGLFAAPFNKILFNASYGISAEDRVLHLRIGFLF